MMVKIWFYSYLFVSLQRYEEKIVCFGGGRAKTTSF